MGASVDQAVSNQQLTAYSFADRQAVPAKCFCQAGFCEPAKFCDSAIYKPAGSGYELRIDKGETIMGESTARWRRMRECWINVYQDGNRHWCGGPHQTADYVRHFADVAYLVYRLHVRLK